MASIYESPGQQVSLTGVQVSPSFQPEQAYDPTGIMAAQSEKDLNAFSQFSQTLSSFLESETKKKIKQQQAEGYNKFLKGEIVVDPNKKDQFILKSALLESRANADAAVATQLAKGGQDPGAASTIIRTSPALRGQQAVGAARAFAMYGPVQMERYLTSKRFSPDLLTLKDGSQVSPLNARGDQVEEVTQLLKTKWIEDSGFGKLNPLLVEETSGYNMAMAENQFMRNWGKDVDERDLKAKQFEIENRGVMTLAPAAMSQEAANQWQTTSYAEKLRWNGNDPVKANEDQLANISDRLKSLAAAGEVAEMEKLKSYLENSPLPGGMTFGQKNTVKFGEFQALIDDTRKALGGSVNLATKRAIDTQYSTYQGLRRTLPPDQLAAARKDLKTSLQANPDPYASTKLNDLEKEDSSMRLATNIETIIRGGNKGQGGKIAFTQTDIDKLVRSEDLEEDQGKVLKELLPEQLTVEDIVKDSGEAIQARVLAQIESDTSRTGAAYIQDKGRQGRFRDIARGATVQATDIVTKRYTAALAKGEKIPGERVINEISIEALKLTELKDSQFYIEKNTGKTPNLLKGPTIPNIPIQSPLLSPAELKVLRQKSGPYPIMSANIVPPPTQDYDYYQKLVTAGAPLPEELRATAKMIGISPEDLMKDYGRKLEKPYVPNTDKEASYRRNFAISPTDANILRNPRSSSSQVRNSYIRLTQLSQVQASKGKALESMRTQLINREGGGKGYDGANKGEGGDTPQGVPGLSRMTIGQVKQLQRQGYYALGAYQFTPGTLPIVQSVAGLSDTDVFDQATQDKLFETVLFQGANNRKNLAGYLNGTSNDIDAAAQDFKNEWSAAKNFDIKPFLLNLRRERQSANFNSPADQKVGKRVNMTTSNIQSITLESPSGQPGIDLWFADKQFGAVLPGVVKDVSSEPGYGNYMVVESIDPLTQQKVDVLYGHLDQSYFKPGDKITAGTAVGKQGGTGNVKSADKTIASVDFLAPAPRGSKSKTPYRNFIPLRKWVVDGIKAGTL
jgi:murein DD-endopeptidase MepM/ murein hydrolase activator NlpD